MLPPPAEKLQNFFGVFLQFQIGVDIYANKNVPDNIIKETLATLIDNVDELAVVHPSGAGLTLETTQRYLDDGIMEIDRMHPAAVEYFAEQGVK